MFAQEKDILIAILLANSFIALMTIIYFVGAYFMYRKTRKLQMEKLSLELTASEHARQGIATQLHNDLGPLLSSVNMRLELVRKKGPEQIDICQETVSRSVQMIRQMTKELSPFGNLHITLKIAIEQYIADQFQSTPLQFNIKEKELPVIPPEKLNQIYRILQEIVQNTIKHARASFLDIEIEMEGGRLLVRTADDGVGFELKKTMQKNKMGCGIHHIFNRVELLHGEIECLSKPGAGTKFHMLIPV